MSTIGSERAHILVTVKTYPTPSQRHVETVCVAGVRLDGPVPTWVRLYPIPFRTLGHEDKFKKWQIVDVDISPRGTTDPRPESYAPDLSSLTLGETVDTRRNWSKRREFIEPLIGSTTTCELIAHNRVAKMNEAAPSLGLVKPTVTRVQLLAGKPWNDKQLAKAKRAAEPDLFNTPLAELQPPNYIVRFHYRCGTTDCPGHRQEVIDWEVGAAAINWRPRYGSETGKMILEKWSAMAASTNDVHFFVGNQHQHRRSFSVLGVWYPKAR